jgi:cold shock CspA family protein
MRGRLVAALRSGGGFIRLVQEGRDVFLGVAACSARGAEGLEDAVPVASVEAAGADVEQGGDFAGCEDVGASVEEVAVVGHEELSVFDGWAWREAVPFLRRWR